MAEIVVLKNLKIVPSDRPLKIAVTGGIGVGKSTVCEILKQCGAKVIDADKIAKLMLNRKQLKVAKLFNLPIGKTGIDRQQLAQIIFNSPEKRHQLEAIIHPLVATKVEAFFRGLKPGEIGIYDIPLLKAEVLAVDEDKQINQSSYYDLVIMVTAPLELRYQRLLVRSSLSKIEVDQRIKAQISDQQRRLLADVVIKNTGNEEELKNILSKKLWPLIISMHK